MAQRVRSTDLFSIPRPFGLLSIAFWANRMQTLYYILYVPSLLAEPITVGFILLAAVCSHLNILLISRHFAKTETPGGYLGMVRRFGPAITYLFVLSGLVAVLLKSTVLIMGYVDIVQNSLFPALNLTMLAILQLCICAYLARLGLDMSVRFAILALIGTIWCVAFYVTFLFQPAADYRHLFPLVPGLLPDGAWNAFLAIWAAFAGPEYLLALPQEALEPKILKKGLVAANAFTALEYIFFSAISLSFYGPEYLRRQSLPIVDMIRYIQLPFVERLEMLIVTAYAISVVYVVAILLLYATGALAWLTGRHSPVGKAYLWVSFGLMVLLIWIAGHWFWPDEWNTKQWIFWLSWQDALTYTVLPAGFLLAGWINNRRKRRG